MSGAETGELKSESESKPEEEDCWKSLLGVPG